MFIPSGFVNFVTWYISVLLVLGALLFEFLAHTRNSHSPILIFIFLSIIQYLITTYGHLDTHTDMTIWGIRNSGVLRGMAELCAGIAGAQMCENLTSIKKTKFMIGIEIALFVFVLADLFLFPHTQYDAIFVVCCIVLISLSFVNGSSQKFSCFFAVLNKLTFAMFFSQNIVRQIWYYLSIKYTSLVSSGFVITMMLFFISLVLFSILLNRIVKIEKLVVEYVKSKL